MRKEAMKWWNRKPKGQRFKKHCFSQIFQKELIQGYDIIYTIK